MPQWGSHFGLGYIAAIPTGATPTPLIFGLLKDISIDFSIALKEIHGQYRYPVAVGEAEGKITGKIGTASILGNTLAAIAGGSAVTGCVIGSPGETFTIPTSPYTCVVSQSANFSADYGVLDLTSGIQMTRAASSPGAINEYAVTAGSYVFYSTAAAHVVLITYSYTAAAAGKTSTILNTPMGIATAYNLVAFGPGTSANIFGLSFPTVHIGKLGMALKVGDWTDHNMDFVVSCSAPGATVATIYTGE